MPFQFSNSGIPRDPLTPEELALAKTIYAALQATKNAATLAELTRILSTLDPDTLSRLLNSISTTKGKNSIQDSLLNVIDLGGQEAIKEIRQLAGKIVFPKFKPTKVTVANLSSLKDLPYTKIPTWASSTRPAIDMNISFNKTNPNSVLFAQKRAGQLITSIDEMTRIGIRQIITEAFTEQLDYRATAKRIKNTIGLHPRWANAVVKYEKTQMARLIKGGVKEATARITAQNMAATYSDRLLSARASMIARTEINIANNQGRLEGWRQAYEAGYIDPATMKMWLTAKDERTCDICGPMDGELVPWNGVFSTGFDTAGNVHPHCRCQMIIVPPGQK